MEYFILFLVVICLALFALAFLIPVLAVVFIVVALAAFVIGMGKGIVRYYQSLITVYGKGVGITLGVVFTLVWFGTMAGMVLLVLNWALQTALMV